MKHRAITTIALAALAAAALLTPGCAHAVAWRMWQHTRANTPAPPSQGLTGMSPSLPSLPSISSMPSTTQQEPQK